MFRSGFPFFQLAAETAGSFPCRTPDHSGKRQRIFIAASLCDFPNGQFTPAQQGLCIFKTDVLNEKPR